MSSCPSTRGSSGGVSIEHFSHQQQRKQHIRRMRIQRKLGPIMDKMKASMAKMQAIQASIEAAEAERSQSNSVHTAESKVPITTDAETDSPNEINTSPQCRFVNDGNEQDDKNNDMLTPVIIHPPTSSVVGNITTCLQDDGVGGDDNSQSDNLHKDKPELDLLPLYRKSKEFTRENMQMIREKLQTLQSIEDEFKESQQRRCELVQHIYHEGMNRPTGLHTVVEATVEGDDTVSVLQPATSGDKQEIEERLTEEQNRVKTLEQDLARANRSIELLEKQNVECLHLQKTIDELRQQVNDVHALQHAMMAQRKRQSALEEALEERQTKIHQQELEREELKYEIELLKVKLQEKHDNPFSTEHLLGALEQSQNEYAKLKREYDFLRSMIKSGRGSGGHPMDTIQTETTAASTEVEDDDDSTWSSTGLIMTSNTPSPLRKPRRSSPIMHTPSSTASPVKSTILFDSDDPLKDVNTSGVSMFVDEEDDDDNPISTCTDNATTLAMERLMAKVQTVDRDNFELQESNDALHHELRKYKAENAAHIRRIDQLERLLVHKSNLLMNMTSVIKEEEEESTDGSTTTTTGGDDASRDVAPSEDQTDDEQQAKDIKSVKPSLLGVDKPSVQQDKNGNIVNLELDSAGTTQPESVASQVGECTSEVSKPSPFPTAIEPVLRNHVTLPDTPPSLQKQPVDVNRDQRKRSAQTIQAQQQRPSFLRKLMQSDARQLKSFIQSDAKQLKSFIERKGSSKQVVQSKTAIMG